MELWVAAASVIDREADRTVQALSPALGLLVKIIKTETLMTSLQPHRELLRSGRNQEALEIRSINSHHRD